MMLIKALGKVGCKYIVSFLNMYLNVCQFSLAFIVNQISEPVKTALYQQLLDILASNEFIDFNLGFMQETI